MSRRVVLLDSPKERARAQAYCLRAPDGWRAEFKAPTRSLQANAAMWAALTEISEQVVWHGLKLSPEDWKDVLTAGLKREVRTVPNVDGTGFVMLGMRTSDMSAAEMGDFIEFIHAFGAAQGVVFKEKVDG